MRVPLAPPGRRRRGAAPGQAAGGLPSQGPAQGARAAADRLDPRAGLDPGAQPPRAGRRDPARGPERARHGRAGLAARGGAEGLVRALRAPGRGRPRAEAEREAYARTVGGDGFALLDLLDGPDAPEELRGLPAVGVLRRVWERQFVREDGPPPGGGVRRRGKDEPQPAGDPVESPYDPEARYRTRSGTAWVGYLVHLSETCEDDAVNLITHAMTTAATVHEAKCTEAIHRALAELGLVPAEHLVDAAYVDAELLVR